MMQFPKSGLYAITPPQNKTDLELIDAVNSVLIGGATAVQYRNKDKTKSVALACSLLELCHRHGVPFIVNDDIELAKHLHADGVHLGQTDSTIDHARNMLGKEAIIGVSCYNSINLALVAQKQNASYVAFGRFFASNTKPFTQVASLNTLATAKTKLQIPCVAIGGILPTNGQQLLDVGADLLAVIGALFIDDPKQAAQEFSLLFQNRNAKC